MEDLDLKKLADNIDLGKKYQHYFNKWVFRCMFLILALYFIYLYSSEIDKTYTYASCPSTAFQACDNPFWYCKNIEISPYYDGWGVDWATTCDDLIKYGAICKGRNCESPKIMPGDYVGRKPDNLIKNFYIFLLILVGNAFIINHLIYLRYKNVR